MRRRRNLPHPPALSIARPQLLKEIEAALAYERRPKIRRRLRALHLVVLGRLPKQAARLAQTNASAVHRWIRDVEKGGLSAVTRDGPSLRISQAEAARMRAAIRAALQEHGDDTTWRRLMAVDFLILGHPAAAIARQFKRAPHTVKLWLAAFLREGTQGLVGRPPSKVHPNGQTRPPSFQTLRKLAAAEKRPRIKRRLLALARSAAQLGEDGCRKGAEDQFVRKWHALSRMMRPEPPRRAKRGRHRKLDRRQQTMLKELIIAKPGISVRELRAFVKAHFDVAYSEEWMRQIVLRQLGFEREDGRFRASIACQGV